MNNPWKLRPVPICATPIAGSLVQIIILGFSTGRADDVHRNTVYEAITIAALFLPLVSIPALWAAVGGLKARTQRGWYVAGVVLNSAYCLLLSVPVLALVSMLAYGSRK
jgi:hypothetical protein